MTKRITVRKLSFSGFN